jgi:O-antigen/teichoic acid export membrane protein
MSFYKKAYLVIASIVFALGCLLCLFLPLFVNATLGMRKIRFYFIAYLLNTVLSYPLAYKKCILYADQNARAVSGIHGLTKVLSFIAQIVLLLWKQSFLLYIVAMIVCTVADNIFCSFYVDKHYAFMKQKTSTKMSEHEKKKFFGNLLPLFIQNVSSTIVTSTDSIIISAFFSVAIVGFYSNYTLITQTLKTLYSQIFSAFTNSFGNLAAHGDKVKSLAVYEHAVFAAFMITAICCSCFLSLIQPFLRLFFGAEYVLSLEIPIAVCASFYFTCMNTPAVSVQNALGLHKKDSWVMIMQAVLNLLLSITLAHFIGLIGVVLGTIISTVVGPFLSKDFVIYKYFFETKPNKIYWKQGLYLILTSVLCFINYSVFNTLLVGEGLGWFIVKSLGSIILPIILLTIFCFRSKSFQYLWKKGKGLFLAKTKSK